jgi:hypothetical protein
MNTLPVKLSPQVARKMALDRALELLGDKHCLHPDFRKEKLRDGLLTAWKAKRVLGAKGANHA